MTIIKFVLVDIHMVTTQLLLHIGISLPFSSLLLFYAPQTSSHPTVKTKYSEVILSRTVFINILGPTTCF